MADLPYTTIEVVGADALAFLQGQLTADLRKLRPGDRVHAAWCNPAGRVICLLAVTAGDGAYALTLPSELAGETLRRLTMYRFRSKVEFSLRPATPDECGLDATDIEGGLRKRLRQGIPEVWSGQSEKFTAHMLNLDLLGAVSLDKGCYTGQEIIARTHYRGATRRRCLRFESGIPVQAGDRVMDGDRDVGEVLNAIGNDLLAVVALDNADRPLSAGGTHLRRLALPYFDPAAA